MMNIVEKKYHTDGEAYYFNTETGEKYGEIVGGFAWPGREDGFLVIAAVDLFRNDEFETRPIRVLAEASESSIDGLLKHGLEFQKRFSPFLETIRFCGDTTSLAMTDFLDRFNRDRRHRGIDPFYLTEAPQLRSPGKLEFYAKLIWKYTQPGRRVLHFCDTVLPSYLLGLSIDEIGESVLDLPPIAALGYALAVLSTWRPRKGEKGSEKREMEMEAKCEHPLTVKPMGETTC